MVAAETGVLRSGMELDDIAQDSHKRKKVFKEPRAGDMQWRAVILRREILRRDLVEIAPDPLGEWTEDVATGIVDL